MTNNKTKNYPSNKSSRTKKSKREQLLDQLNNKYLEPWQKEQILQHLHHITAQANERKN